MGAYSDANTTLQFTPLAYLLAIQVSNDAGHGTLTMDSVVVKSSSVALWGSATVHNLTQNSRHYTLDSPYAVGDNDSVVLAGLNTDDTTTSMALDVAQGGSATVHLYIPAIGNNVSNKFTFSVYAHTATGTSASYRYSLTQQNDFSGNIPCGKLAGVPFTLSADNETVLTDATCILYYTTSTSDNLQSKIEAIATANNTTVTISGSQSEGWAATFADPISYIPESSFYEARDSSHTLTSVTIPNGVTTIGSAAFLECLNLTSVTIPKSVTSIGSYAFWECTGLDTMTISNNETTIGGGAFGQCNHLGDVYCLSLTPPRMGDNSFLNISVAARLHVPASAVSTYRESAWYSYFRGGIFGDAPTSKGTHYKK